MKQNNATQTEDSLLLEFNNNPAKPLQRKTSLTLTLKSLVENRLHSDVIFSVCDEYIAAHTFLLVARSDVFARMFDFCKVSGQIITINDMPADTFRQLLLYMYTDEIDITNNNVIDLLYAAHKYDLGFLEDQCKEFIDEQKTFSNVLSTINILYHFNGFHSLKNKLFAYVCDNFYDHFNQPDCFTKIDSIDLVKYLLEKLVALNHKADNGRFEYDLFQMLMEWANKKIKQQGLPDTSKNVRDVLEGAEQLINFDQMNAELLNKCVATNKGFFTKDEVCKFFMRDNNPSEIHFTRNNVHNSIMHQEMNGCVFIRTTPENLINRRLQAITDFDIET